MIVLVAGEGEAEALDGPRDEEGRNVVLGGIERLGECLHAMTAKVGEQRRERRIVMLLQECVRRFADFRFNASAPGAAALVMQG